MMKRDYLIIGAGLAGASACEGIREHDGKGSVLMVGREAFLPYHRPPLSKSFLREKHPSVEKLLKFDATWYEKKKIEVRTQTQVRAFDIDRRLAVLEDGQTFEFRKALLATGSRPRRPAVAGANLGHVFYLNHVREAQAILETGAALKSVVVIGGGFLALETAASLTMAKMKVTLLNRNQSLWQKWMDADTSHWLTEYFREHGVTLLLGQDLNGFEGKTVLKNVQTKSGERLPAPMAIVAIGAEPNLGLVAHTPLSGPLGTPVNDYLETDEKGIYAAGDVALYPDRIFGGLRRVTHWENALEQGKVAGQNMTGKKRIKFDRVPYYFTQLFDLHFSFFGDFTLPPMRVELEGKRETSKFTVRHFRHGKLVAIVTVHQGAAHADGAREEIRAAQK